MPASVNKMTTISKSICSCKVRGRPIAEQPREVLEIEIMRQREQIAALQESIRLNHLMWSRAMNEGAMTGNPASYHQEARK